MKGKVLLVFLFISSGTFSKGFCSIVDRCTNIKNVNKNKISLNDENLEKSNKFKIFGDLLFWKTCQGFSDPGTKYDILSENYKYLELNPDYGIGFKVGFEAGKQQGNAFYAEYLWYHQEDKKLVNEDLFVNKTKTFLAEYLNSKRNLELDILDIALNFCNSYKNKYCYKFYTGIKGGILDLKHKNIVIGSVENILMKIKDDSKFIGPFARADLCYHLFQHFSVLGKMSAAVIYQGYDINAKFIGVDGNGLINETYKGNPKLVNCCLDTSLGLNFSVKKEKDLGFNVFFGYDFLLLTNQIVTTRQKVINDDQVVAIPYHKDDIGFHGFNIGLYFLF